jgi:hypothetical protein
MDPSFTGSLESVNDLIDLRMGNGKGHFKILDKAGHF